MRRLIYQLMANLEHTSRSKALRVHNGDIM